MKTLRPTLNLGLMAAVAVLLGWAVAANNADAGHTNYGCHSCHVPHAAATDQAVPLWNPAHTTTTMTGNYTSPTMDATTGAPDGASKLCLSCHDGSYDHVIDEHSFTTAARPTGEMGGLETTHPISFSYADAYATDGELEDPANLASDILDANGKVQCTSCHDVHATSVADIPDDPTTSQDESIDQPNLRWPYYASYGVTSSFCRHCHSAK